MEIMEVLKIALPALAGGGFMWFFNLRLRIRRQGNEMYESDFNAVSQVVNKAMDDLRELSNRVAELEIEKSRIMQEMGRLRAENEALKEDNAKMVITLKRYIQQNNPNITR